MQIDTTTYSDLSVFQTTDEHSIFSKLDRTRTVGGRMQLLEFFNNPFSNIDKIRQTQEIIRIIRNHENDWGPYYIKRDHYGDGAVLRDAS